MASTRPAHLFMSDSLIPQQRRRAEETRPNVEANDDSDDWENYDDDEDIDGEVATISLTNANCDDLPPGISTSRFSHFVS